jgi:hypothetical protein
VYLAAGRSRLSEDWKSEVALDFALFSMCRDSVKRAGEYRQAAKMVAIIFTQAGPVAEDFQRAATAC